MDSTQTQPAPASVPAAAVAAPGAAAKPIRNVKKKAVRQVPHACAYIQATFNNTIVTLTDLNGNALAWSSAGSCGFRGPKKATPYAASMIVKTAAEKAADYGIRDLSVLVKGVGQGRDGALRALNANGFNVVSMRDVTAVPHNGCRSKRARRM